MKIIHAIAEYLSIPNEWIVVDYVGDGMMYFHYMNGSSKLSYTCKLGRNNTMMKKGSVRADR